MKSSRLDFDQLFVNKLIHLFWAKSWYENYLKSIALFFFRIGFL